MKKLITLSAVAIGLLASAAGSQAQTITSIQFNRGAYGQGFNIPSGDLAGVVPVANWNTSDVTGHPGNIPTAFDYDNEATFTNNAGPLVTSTGSTSSVGFSITSYGNVTGGSSYSGPNQTGNSDLLYAGAGTGGTGAIGNNHQDTGNDPVSLTLSGLNANDTYSFILYVTTVQPAVEYSLSDGASTQYALGPNGGAYLSTNGPSTFVDGASTSDFVQTIGGGDGASPSQFAGNVANYIEFTGITGVTSMNFALTELGNFGGNGSFLSAAEGGNEAVALTGIQVIDVPEPATVWLFALGFAGLVFQIQRKRLAKL